MWHKSIDEITREKLFAWMREKDREYQAALERSYALQAPHGMLAVGSAAFDPFLMSEAIRLFLAALNKGADPAEAAEQAKSGAREAIRLHNANRPKDLNWQRWEGAADGRIESLHYSLKVALKAE